MEALIYDKPEIAWPGLLAHISGVRAVAQLPMFASRIAAAQLRKTAEASKPIASTLRLIDEWDFCTRPS
jgi:hypothetical protein